MPLRLDHLDDLCREGGHVIADLTPSEACDAEPVAINSSAIRLAWSPESRNPVRWNRFGNPATRRRGGDGGVDAHEFAIHVHQCAAGVTRVDRRVGLDGVEHGVLVEVSPPAATGRFNALTIPVVTVPSGPSGDPMATTSCPTRRLAEDPSAIGVGPDTPSARTTAISVARSVPTTVNGRCARRRRSPGFCSGGSGDPGGRTPRQGWGPSRQTWVLGAGSERPSPRRRRGCWSGSGRRRTARFPTPPRTPGPSWSRV